jgi:hypothetical protein
MGIEQYVRGLCASCKNAREVRSATSLFVMCELSKSDARFPKYPRLPVLQCPGYERAQSSTTDVREH